MKPEPYPPKRSKIPKFDDQLKARARDEYIKMTIVNLSHLAKYLNIPDKSLLVQWVRDGRWDVQRAQYHLNKHKDNLEACGLKHVNEPAEILYKLTMQIIREAEKRLDNPSKYELTKSDMNDYLKIIRDADRTSISLKSQLGLVDPL